MKKYISLFLFSVFFASCVTTQNVGFAQKEREYWNTPPDLTKVIYAGGDGKSV
jgi:PBP1b-binding outer membrane lipoprotein LpoB